MSLSALITPQTLPLPPAATLEDACEQVINQPRGDSVLRFVQATQGRTGQALVDSISRLINDPADYERFDNQLKRYPNLLFIEDYVRHNGLAWHFDQQTVDRAVENAWYYDSVVRSHYGLSDHFTRYN